MKYAISVKGQPLQRSEAQNTTTRGESNIQKAQKKHCRQEVVGPFQQLKPAPPDLESFGSSKHHLLLMLVVPEHLSPWMVEHLYFHTSKKNCTDISAIDKQQINQLQKELPYHCSAILGPCD